MPDHSPRTTRKLHADGIRIVDSVATVDNQKEVVGQKCQHCGGTGKCPGCIGKGFVLPKSKAGTRVTGDTIREVCTDCAASGKCQVCNGLGEAPQSKPSSAVVLSKV